MTETDGQAGPPPEYGELYSMITKLLELLESRTRRDVMENAREESESDVTPVSRFDVTKFWVIPDLNKTIAVFNRLETSHQAEDWFGDVNGMVAMNGWP